MQKFDFHNLSLTRVLLIAMSLAAITFLAMLPRPVFDRSTSSVIFDRSGGLIAARIADDGQWRFPAVDTIPAKLETCILYYEDEYFHWHPGFNPVSMIKAAIENFEQGKVTRGASTITMQVVRLSRNNPSRTYAEKLLEVFRAMRLELWFSKEDILAMYASHAPYGGNVVGVEAASFRYFNRPLSALSWAEYALLAVLPNSPALMHPGRNRDQLAQKRNRLLEKLKGAGVIDETTCSLAKMEPIPSSPLPVPTLGYHILELASSKGLSGQRVKTSIHPFFQQKADEIVNAYVERLLQNQVSNACLMVASVQTGEVVAYVGNSQVKGTRSPYVDLIQSPRSSGSILKPFLYATAIDEGLIHPSTLLRDVPIAIGDYAPENFDKQYAGLVAAGKALSTSLNIPATSLLRNFGIAPFLEELRHLGFTTINRSAGNYGLSLILGGAEVTLWDLVKIYRQEAALLYQSVGMEKDIPALNLFGEVQKVVNKSRISPGAWWQISEALTDVVRPGASKDWQKFSSSRKIAWKTGTSHGFRDAWAVGYNRDYVVGVWVGNADGEGRPGLTGISAAAPLMFSCFNILTDGHWFSRPDGYLKEIKLCEQSGLLPNPHCPQKAMLIPEKTELTQRCEYHQRIFLNEGGFRVDRSCGDIVTDTVWFTLDPVASYYLKKVNPFYRQLPAVAPDCQDETRDNLDIIYPAHQASLFVPRGFDGELEKVLLKAAHRSRAGTLYWHIDDRFIGVTKTKHEISAKLKPGKHLLLVMDENGNKKRVVFYVKIKA